MSKNTTETMELFNKGYSCAQAVFIPYAQEYGIDIKEAVRLSSFLGGGMGQLGETCGAVTGAFLSLGLIFGKDNMMSQEEKIRASEISKKFMDEFLERSGSIVCNILTEKVRDSSLDEDTQRKIISKSCSDYVNDAVEIIEKLRSEYEED